MRIMSRIISIVALVLIAHGVAHAQTPTPRPTVGAICGDVDGDGRVTQDDATIVNQLAAGVYPGNSASLCKSAGPLQCGDVDEDGYVGLLDWKQIQRASVGLSSPCTVEGFGDKMNRLSALLRSDSTLPTYDPNDRPYDYIWVTSNADIGSGTLRQALAQSVPAGHGRLIVFNLGANQTIILSSPLIPPAYTVIDGIGSRVALDATAITSNGALRVYNTDVAVRHIRVRNSGQDGIQIAPKGSTKRCAGGANAGKQCTANSECPSSSCTMIQNIVIHRVSVTQSKDGGIDVTGCMGLTAAGCDLLNGGTGTVQNVTLAENFLGANGTITCSGGTNAGAKCALASECPGGACGNNGGGTLLKYGATNVTMVGNYWDKNLRRNPAVDNRDGSDVALATDSLVDVRHSLVRSPRGAGGAAWVQSLATRAKVNVVNACFEGSSAVKTIVQADNNGAAYVSGNVIPNPDPNPYVPTSATNGGSISGAPFSVVPCVSRTNRDAVFDEAGALPRDAVDSCIIGVATNYDDAIKCCKQAPFLCP